MSEKVVLSERKTKEVKLPESGATVNLYASVLIQDLEGINVGSVKEGSDDLHDAIKLLTKIIKSWNVYESQESESPRPIDKDSVGELPIRDLNAILEELKSFVASEKKE